MMKKTNDPKGFVTLPDEQLKAVSGGNDDNTEEKKKQDEHEAFMKAHCPQNEQSTFAKLQLGLAEKLRAGTQSH